MTVQQLIDATPLTAVALPRPDKELAGVYIGDLLSWVMGKAEAADAWITIMSNQNIVAVATLTDVACIVLAEGVEPDEGVADLAAAKNVNILSSPFGAYETALVLRDCL